MMLFPRNIALLDANVLYPAPIRDYLLELANIEVYQPKWTALIQEEWIHNLLAKRKDINRNQLDKTVEAMNAAFPDANVTSYEHLISKLSLPDEKDRHVLASGIEINADVIVTFNLKDFPVEYLKTFEIEVLHPDDFIADLIRTNKESSIIALNNIIHRLKNPPKSKYDVLNSLRNCGLKNSVSLLS